MPMMFMTMKTPLSFLLKATVSLRAAAKPSHRDGLIALFLAVTMLFPIGSAAQTIKEKDLPPQHQEWLKLVSYIILQKEKDVFLQLATDRDRDIFIESFWKQPDPTSGRPANELGNGQVR